MITSMIVSFIVFKIIMFFKKKPVKTSVREEVPNKGPIHDHNHIS